MTGALGAPVVILFFDSTMFQSSAVCNERRKTMPSEWNASQIDGLRFSFARTWELWKKRCGCGTRLEV